MPPTDDTGDSTLGRGMGWVKGVTADAPAFAGSAAAGCAPAGVVASGTSAAPVTPVHAVAIPAASTLRRLTMKFSSNEL
ncbi:hypothetical protein GCM10009802_12110 [Streptomyces synnematoformans]|uniref:Uncharacterized protein n=1 Tax=Streptomyces synnematoformans TaxID=415721 RepID=A0ABN2XN50_9ACTN